MILSPLHYTVTESQHETKVFQLQQALIQHWPSPSCMMKYMSHYGNS